MERIISTLRDGLTQLIHEYVGRCSDCAEQPLVTGPAPRAVQLMRDAALAFSL